VLHAGDGYHARAARAFRELLESKQDLVTTSYVLVETTALLQHRFGLAAVRAFQGCHTICKVPAWTQVKLSGRAMPIRRRPGREEKPDVS
jgi:predicted nucleic acid-binding protein